ncbi:MAG: hypothetical protein Q9P01_22270 [Anaerolineae bacterium]|nr:hypothetical protein [Anaerolineae bacterium]MDQ7037465.1 hypothetical protein [Anaerolineae bacterium]
MRLIVDGQVQDFVALKIFRDVHHLPDTFGVALFEPKDFTGLATIDKGGSEMNELRQGILDSIPEAFSLMDALTVADTLRAVFRNGMYGINDVIGLKVAEVEFAVASFGDVLRDWVYALIRCQSTQSAVPQFQQIYGDWLNASTRLSHHVHDYSHKSETWHINIINNAYGRVGLQVQRGAIADYVQDGMYACPAEGYMMTLLTEVTALLTMRLA